VTLDTKPKYVNDILQMFESKEKQSSAGLPILLVKKPTKNQSTEQVNDDKTPITPRDEKKPAESKREFDLSSVSAVLSSVGTRAKQVSDARKRVLQKASEYILEGNKAEFDSCIWAIDNYDSAVDDEGNTLLHWCAACNQPDMARSLIMRGAQLKVNIHNESPFQTAKHQADADGNPESYQEILDLLSEG